MQLTDKQIELLIRKTDEIYAQEYYAMDWISMCELVYKIRHDEATLGFFDEEKVLDFASLMDCDDSEIFIGEQLQNSDREV